jgi:hypothetical protein
MNLSSLILDKHYNELRNYIVALQDNFSVTPEMVRSKSFWLM